MNAIKYLGQQRRKAWAKVTITTLPVLIFVADAYALYQVHMKRMGNALDYYPFWTGGREAVLNRQSPYDPAAMEQMQWAIHGRPAVPDENQHGYAHPAYAPFVVLPFLLPPFPISESLWITGQQILAVAAVILTVRATGWQIGPLVRGLLKPGGHDLPL